MRLALTAWRVNRIIHRLEKDGWAEEVDFLGEERLRAELLTLPGVKQPKKLTNRGTDSAQYFILSLAERHIQAGSRFASNSNRSWTRHDVNGFTRKKQKLSCPTFPS